MMSRDLRFQPKALEVLVALVRRARNPAGGARHEDALYRRVPPGARAHDSGTNQTRFPNHSHWGAFLAEVEDGRVVGVRPFAARSRSVAAARGDPGGGPFANAHRAADGAARAGSRTVPAPAKAAGASASCRSRGSARSISWPASSTACSASTATAPSWAARRAGARPASSTMRARRCAASSPPLAASSIRPPTTASAPR